ncbi:hypothetical protein M422DRAFT_64693 [Sphaerobolus stellatus SS14]|nr:hypothetical protein M422DRAFT_64693 [Sphaerobolus stellatus SS14]
MTSTTITRNMSLRLTAQESPSKKQEKEQHTRDEFRAWCFRADAVARCFIRDIHALKEYKNAFNDVDFWMLGTVPCYTVEFVGILVGATAYESKVSYIIEDGTGSILCTQFSPKPSKYKKINAKEKKGEPVKEDILKPLYEIGETIRVTARVVTWRDTKQANANSMERCWPNEEIKHWIATSKLHQNYYSQPFTIPPISIPVPATPIKFSRPHTPTTTSTSATASSRRSSSVASGSPAGPPRLRHPSRLRSKDLLPLTFKTYLLNFMDSAFRFTSAGLDDGDDDDDDLVFDGGIHESPSKRLKRMRTQDDPATPRPSRVLTDATPRPLDKWKLPASYNPSLPKGFTLSYLRRVPELAQLAAAVVEAERKRRAKEVRRKEKEGGRTSQHVSQIKKESQSQFQEPSNKKAKRLYHWAIRELHKEGSIFVQDPEAPIWRAPPPPGIWKSLKEDDSIDTTGITTFSTINLSSTSGIEDPGEISDPSPNEESYLPLQTSILHEPILEAIKSLIFRNKRKNPGSRSYGPSIADIRSYLQNKDEKWANLGEYAVTDALEELKEMDKVFSAAGCWKMTL